MCLKLLGVTANVLLFVSFYFLGSSTIKTARRPEIIRTGNSTGWRVENI